MLANQVSNSLTHIHSNSPIAVYLRKSQLEDGQNAEETLAKHRQEIERYIEANGFENVTWYEEVESGEKIEFRPEMTRLLEDVSEGKYVAVVAIHIDRLSRGDMFDRGIMVKAFKESNTLLITTSNNKIYNFGDDTSDSILSEIELTFSNYEYKTIKRRFQEGKKRAFENGKIVGSKPPFGYYKDYNTDEYLIDEEKAKIYLWIVDQYLSGKSAHKIAQELNRNKVPTPSGRKNVRWSHTYILNTLLKNPFYAGYVVINRSKTKKIGQKKHKRKRFKPHEYIKRKGTHKPLISEETYEKILEIMKDNVKRPPVTRANKFRLSGLVKCLACGYGVTVRRKKRADGTEYALLRKCKYPLADGTTCEANRGIKEQILVDALYEDMKRYKERLFSEIEVEEKPKLDVDPISVQEAIIDEANGKIQRAKMLFIEGDISKEDYDKIKEKESERIHEAKEEIKRLSVSPEAKIEEQRKKWKNVDLDKIFFEEFPKEEFNRIIRTLVDSIYYLYDGENLTVKIEYR
jgi:site-specific DNA recombinase